MFFLRPLILLGFLAFGIPHDGDIWMKDVKQFSKSSLAQAGDKKLLVFPASSVLTCGAICLQTGDCSFFQHQNQSCCGYNSNTRLPHSDMSTKRHGSFRRYRKKVLQDDYKNLTVEGMNLYVKKYDSYLTQVEALEVCEADGATLLKMDTKEKTRVIRKGFKTKSSMREDFWIGLIKKNGTWSWTDGTRFGKYRPWEIGQPNDIDSETCVAICIRIVNSGRLFDLPCEDSKKFLCEKALPPF